MPNVTGTTADVFIDERWSPELNLAVRFKTVIMELFADWTSKMQNSGDLFHLPSDHNLTANTKTAGTDATPEAITETQQNFTVSTHQIVAQTIEDFAEVMSKYDIRAGFTSKAAYALARAMDVTAGALLDDNTSQTQGVLTAELTDDNMIRSWQYLEDAGGAEPPYKAILSPAGWAGLLKIDKYTNVAYTGDNAGKALHRAQVSMLYDTTFYRSSLLPGTAPNASGHLWAGEHFFKIVKRYPTMHTWYSPLATAWVLSSDAIYGAFERQEADEAAAATTVARLHGVRLQHLK